MLITSRVVDAGVKSFGQKRQAGYRARGSAPSNLATSLAEVDAARRARVDCADRH